MTATKGQRGWGHIRQRNNKGKRFQASYVGPDKQRHYAPTTYTHRIGAEGWLSKERQLIEMDNWTPPAQREQQKLAGSITLAEYGTQWIKERNIKENTRQHYETLLRCHIKPKLGNVPLRYLSLQTIQTWYATTLVDEPTARARAYGLLHAICASAVKAGLLVSNPCQIERAMKARTKKAPVILAPKEVRKLALELPAQYRALVLIAAACGLRWGEAIELRRKDIEGDVIHVHRAVTHRGRCDVGSTKSGYRRDVVIPATILPDIKAHLDTFVGNDFESLLFVPARGGCHLNDKVFREGYLSPAATAIGRPALTFHHLRHFQGHDL